MPDWTRSLPALLIVVFGCDGCGGKDGDTATGAWSSLIAEGEAGGTLLAGGSLGDEAVFVGGAFDTSLGLLVRWDGEGLCTEVGITDRVLWWIHGQTANDWYAVGEGGTVLHEVDGVRTREDVPSPDLTLFGVYDDGSFVWAVGGQVFGNGLGEVWRRTSGAATPDWMLWAEGVVSQQYFFKVWESWVVGPQLARTIEGDTWTDHPLPNDERLLTVRGRADDDVWAVGGLSTPEMVHWDGTQWSAIATEPACGSRELMGVWTGPGEDVWVSGASGTSAMYDGTTWHCNGGPPMTGDPFHAVWKHDDDVFWIGGNLTDSVGPYQWTLARLGDHGPADVRPCD